MNRLATTNDRYKKRLAAIPALATFCDQAEQMVHVEDPESFWRIEPAFRDLLASNFIESFLLYELKAVAEDHFHFMSGSSEFHAPLAESAGYSLMIKLASPEALVAAPITSLTEHLLLAVNGNAELQRLAIEEPFCNDILDRSKQLVVGDLISLVPGMILRFHSPSEMFRLRFERPLLMIQLQSVTAVPLRWVFNPETLQPYRAVASRLSSSRLQFTCHTLAALGSPTSIPALKKLIDHPDHYVRWAAIQGICAISREDGLECLHRSLGDRHPHIRNAAQKTLSEF
jgi:hypothetical protein